ncbi:MAG TPA: CpsD/CapB family tyrosine-protein kinase [Gaiellaceae bacterium]|nr:CpsD/CapB family tyrosine-protein kinase [Gaiellaceae bacterium]
MSGAFDPASARVRYWHALRAHRLLIGAVTATALVAALLVVVTATKRYDASADLSIQPLPAFSANDPFQGLPLFRVPADGSSAAVTAARIFASPNYRGAFEKKLGPDARRVKIEVTPLSQADIVSLGVSAPNATLAAHVANRFTSFIVAKRKAVFNRALTQKIKQIRFQIGLIPRQGRAQNPQYLELAGTVGQLLSFRGQADPTVLKLTPATTPAAASWPRPTTTVVVALVVGLLLGVAAAVALEVVSPRFTREEELTLEHRLPVLARIPRLPSRSIESYFLGQAPLPRQAWKAYRTLRAVLSNAGGNGDGFPRSVLVTSAGPGDGKTLTAVNLAIALSSAGLSVTLVDADLPRPMVGTIFNIVGHRDGVVHLLNNPSATRTGTVEAPLHARLKLLLASEEQMHELHLFEAQRIKQLLDRLARDSDVVVVDSPPLPEVAEAVALADACEAVVVCVRIGHTRRDKLTELRDLLSRRGVVPLGFFVASRRGPRRDREHGYQGYPGELPVIPGDYLLSPQEPTPSADSS